MLAYVHVSARDEGCTVDWKSGTSVVRKHVLIAPFVCLLIDMESYLL